MATPNSPFVSPFVKKEAPVAETPVTEAPAAKAPKKATGERKAPAAPLTKEQMDQVLALVPTTSYSEIAAKLGITKFQVNRVLVGTKKRLRKLTEAKPELTDKIEAYIKNYLSRPEEAKVGGSKGGGKVAKAFEDIINSIIAKL
jgi:hypothetical protein